MTSNLLLCNSVKGHNCIHIEGSAKYAWHSSTAILHLEHCNEVLYHLDTKLKITSKHNQ
jgi:hypothetical protein